MLLSFFDYYDLYNLIDPPLLAFKSHKEKTSFQQAGSFVFKKSII